VLNALIAFGALLSAGQVQAECGLGSSDYPACLSPFDDKLTIDPCQTGPNQPHPIDPINCKSGGQEAEKDKVDFKLAAAFRTKATGPGPLCPPGWSIKPGLNPRIGCTPDNLAPNTNCNGPDPLDPECFSNIDPEDVDNDKKAKKVRKQAPSGGSLPAVQALPKVPAPETKPEDKPKRTPGMLAVASVKLTSMG